MDHVKVSLESGPFFEIDLEPNHLLVIKPSITSVVLMKGECYCMGQKLEVGKKVYFKPFSDTMLFTLNSPCKLSFKTPLSYIEGPLCMKPLFNAYKKLRQISSSGKCPVTVVCGGSTKEKAVVLRTLVEMMGNDGIFPFCMDLDLDSCSLGLPGTVSGAPLLKSDVGFPPCFYTKLPYDEKKTISFLYGSTKISDLEFYMQLVENLTVRVARLMKSDTTCNKFGVIINAPTYESIVNRVLEVTRPNVVISLDKDSKSVTEVGPFECFPLEPIPVADVSCPSYFGPSSEIKSISLKDTKIINNEGHPVGLDALKNGTVLGVLYSGPKDPYLVKFFVCVISSNSISSRGDDSSGGRIELLYPSEGAARTSVSYFVTTDMVLKQFCWQ